MRRPKVDLTGCTLLALQAAPKVKDRATGEVATDASGRTKYAVTCFVSDPETQDAGSVNVTIPSVTPIDLTPGLPVRLINPRVMHWETGNGRSGMAWSADGIEPVAQARRGGESS